MTARAVMIPRPEVLKRASWIALMSGWLALCGGACGLLGWVFDNDMLKTAFTGGVSMKANAAVCLCLLASAMLCLQSRARRRVQVRFAQGAATTTLIVAGVTLIEHISGWNPGLDELLFAEPVGAAATSSPGRMGLPATISFLLLSSGVLSAIRSSGAGNREPSQYFALATYPLPLFAILGYATGATQLYGIAKYTGIALHTALAILLSAICLFLSRAERAPASLLVADNPGGEVARTMLPAAVVLPLGLGWLRTMGQAQGFYDTSFGRALLLLSLMVLFTTMVWRMAWRLSAVASEREAAEQASTDAKSEALRLAAENVAHKAALLDSERAARIEAERAAALKDQFLATLSHELRTPLNAILGWARIARQAPGRPPDLERPLEIIERNARAQAQLIEDLLDISRITSGKIRLNKESIELPAVIQAAINAAAPTADAKQVRISFEHEPGLPSILADAARIQQVVSNLLSNAIKFTPRDGHIELRLRSHKGQLELTVKDDGIGITAEFLPHVFDRFRQADAGTTRRHGGLGLGLSIVKQLVELHGGSVQVSSPGHAQGATFSVLLPLLKEADALRAPESKRWLLPDAALSGVRVLVVDDESDAREFVGRVLSDLQASVSTAGSVDEALNTLERVRPHIVVSDIGMPGKDGYELIHAVRQMHDAKAIPAIAVTAFARAEDRMRALSAGFQLHVAKPVDPHELTLAVASLVGRTGASSPPPADEPRARQA